MTCALYCCWWLCAGHIRRYMSNISSVSRWQSSTTQTSLATPDRWIDLFPRWPSFLSQGFRWTLFMWRFECKKPEIIKINSNSKLLGWSNHILQVRNDLPPGYGHQAVRSLWVHDQRHKKSCHKLPDEHFQRILHFIHRCPYKLVNVTQAPIKVSTVGSLFASGDYKINIILPNADGRKMYSSLTVFSVNSSDKHSFG